MHSLLEQLSSLLATKLHHMKSSLYSQICSSKKDHQLNFIINSSHDKRRCFQQIKSMSTSSALFARVNWNHLSSSEPVENWEIFNYFLNSVY